MTRRRQSAKKSDMEWEKNKNKMKISVTAGICILILRCVPVKEAKRWLICSSALSSDCSDYSSLTFYLRVWVQSWGKFKPLILHRDLNQAYVYQHLLILLKCWSREPWLHSVRADSSTEIAPVHRRRGTFLKNLGLFLPLKITRSHSKFALARKSPLHLSHRGVYCWKVFFLLTPLRSSISIHPTLSAVNCVVYSI